jgi:hypothetical protein
VSFGLLQHLERWERPAAGSEPAASDAAQRCREFPRGAGGSAIPLVYPRAQLVKGTNGHIYVVTPDGTTVILREDAARELCEKYSEHSPNGTREFSLRLTFQIAAPVDDRPGHRPSDAKYRQDIARIA